ncbi:Curli production assembly/transport component CsgG [Candidatus Magnetoovum chiemensis]|nr:Curli production assembly/transport component CsgG [Candidatus Magnetoovum chiemensis]
MLSCAANQKDDRSTSHKYGQIKSAFRGTWWNHYERGMSFARGKYYPDAINDFKTAINKRQDDKWRARTYGMHFIDYFAHRELGIAYYNTGRIDEAIAELETSLSSADSARAKYFLNKARASLMKNTGIIGKEPIVYINSPLSDSVINTLTAQISGTVEAQNYVSALSINGKPLLLELSAKRLAFDETVNLQLGLNTITVLALDLMGKKSSSTVTVKVDRQGPLIVINDLTKNSSNNTISINGAITDASGIDEITVNGHKLEAGKSLEYTFSHSFKQNTRNTDVLIQAKDLVGNITSASVPVVSASSALGQGLLIADANISNDNSFSDAFNYLTFNVKALFDKEPPVIKLAEPTDIKEIYLPNLLIEGNVSDNKELQSIKINSEELLKKPSKQAFFSSLVELKEGENVFTVEVKDANGNVQSKQVKAVRKIQEVKQIGLRLSVGILPFENTGSSAAEAESVYDNLISSFVNDGRFNVLERVKLDEVLKELKLSQSSLVEPEVAAKTGKLLSAETMLMGSVIERENSIEIIARLVDTETSAILASNDVFDEDKSVTAVKKLANNLSYKFKRDFPLTQGIIIQTDNSGTITTDIGKERKIKQGDRIILFREGEEVKHPVTGKVLGSKTVQLGEAKIKEIDSEFSTAEIITKKDALNVMDKVITK